LSTEARFELDVKALARMKSCLNFLLAVGQGLIIVAVNPRVLATATNITSFGQLFWIWKDLIESKLFMPVDCFLVHRFDQIEKPPVKVSFVKEIWSIVGEKKTYVEVLQKSMAEGGR
jgi:hypothetical protein